MEVFRELRSLGILLTPPPLYYQRLLQPLRKFFHFQIHCLIIKSTTITWIFISHTGRNQPQNPAVPSGALTIRLLPPGDVSPRFRVLICPLYIIKVSRGPLLTRPSYHLDFLPTGLIYSDTSTN
jgi:hypothetical protein